MSAIPGSFWSNPKWWPTYKELCGLGIATQAGTAGRVHLAAIWVPRSMMVSRITGGISTVGGAGTTMRLGLYADNGYTPVGGNLLEETTLAADVGGVKTFTLANQRYLEAGFYWLAFETQDAIVVFSRAGGTALWTDVSTETLAGCFYDRGGGYGALTNPCPAVTTSTTAAPAGRLRIETIA